MQEKILRVIEYGEYERVGGSETLRADVRIVGATNEDLPTLAEAGRFRHDLLDRLAFDVVTVPPLRARPEDIRLLADHFALNITSELGRPFFPGFANRAMDELLAHAWPGNVRELKNVVERAVYRAAPPEEPVTTIQFDPFESPWRIGGETPSPAPGEPDWPIDLKAEVAELECRRVRDALAANGFHQGRAAEALGLSYHQLRGLLRKYGVDSRASA
jgi:psp operon transcriptional activator